VSSVEPDRWDDVTGAYGRATDRLAVVLPAAAAQGLLAFAHDRDPAWLDRLVAAAERIR
jgi:hypothetical protein